MDPTGIGETLASAGPIGVIIVMAIALIAAVRGDWVPGYLYREKRDECKELREMVVRLTGLATRGTQLTERAVDKVIERQQ